VSLVKVFCLSVSPGGDGREEVDGGKSGERRCRETTGAPGSLRYTKAV